MATTDELKQRIAVFARELAAEFADIDDSEALSWLDAIETKSIEIGDAVQRELLQQQATDCPTEAEANCPKCGRLGHYKGPRERKLLGRRGVVAIGEPEYYCPCCRKAFFPADRSARR